MLQTDGRTALLAAAEHALADVGLDEITTREICTRAGVGAPTLYHHFGSKDGLLDALVAETFERYMTAKVRMTATGDARTDLARGWDNHVEFARANAAIYPLMLRAGSDAAAASQATLREGFEGLAQQGVLHPGVDAELATLVLSSALRGVAARVAAAPGDPVATTAAGVLRDTVIDRLLRSEQR